jgi:hypothetical protein
MLINPLAVEKLASEKSAKIKTRQEALQGIYFDHLDIFYLPISANFEKRGFFNSHSAYHHLSQTEIADDNSCCRHLSVANGISYAVQFQPTP